MKAISVLVTFASLLASAAFSTAAARPYLVWCQDCTGMQKHALASEQPAGTIVYVADAVHGTIAAYRVESRGGGGPHTPPSPYDNNKFAVSINEDPGLVSDINGLMSWYNLSPVGFYKHAYVAISDTPVASTYDSVYDVINAGPSRNQFVDSMGGSNNALLFSIGTVAQFLQEFHIVNSDAVPDVKVTYTFADGSTVDLVYDNQDADIRMDPDSARDSHNNNVPYVGEDGKTHGLGGEHSFGGGGSGSDLQNFHDQLILMGVPVTTGGGPAGGEPFSGWACTSVSDGSYFCILY